MSASSKKKLRKELNAAAMTEKQLKEAKDAKKLKAYTLTFVVVMVLVLAITVGIALRTPISSAISRGTHSVTIGEHELSTAMLSYYYVDTIVSHYNQYSSYGDYAYLYAMWMEGINFNTPVGSQIRDSKTGETWADYYIQEAIKRATSVLAIYDKAMADTEFKVSEDTTKYYNEFEEYLELYAQLYGYSSVNGYLRSQYGAGANVDDYKNYSQINDIATEYYNAHKDSLKYEAPDFDEYAKDKYENYSSFDYSMFAIDYEDYLTGGTESTNEKGDKVVTYSDEEKAAALAAALEDAKKLTEDSTIVSTETFEVAVKLIEKYKEEKTPVTSKTDVFYENLSDKEMKEWMKSADRQPGDRTYIEIHDVDENGEATDTIVGYYVILFQGRDDNNVNLKNVRHILVKFTGGTKDSTTGKTTYSDAEKAATQAKAEEILAAWNALEEKSAEAFGKLATEKTEDTGSKETGGLYEDVYPGQMVEAFEDWCFDEQRYEGEVGIIETEYGFHVMYFVGNSEMTYRNYLINIDMVNDEMDRWEKELMDAMTVTQVNINGINKDYYIG